MKLRSVVGALLAAGVCTAAAEDVDEAMYDYKSQLTLAGYAGGDAAIENFPLLVRISPERISGFVYADCSLESLRFGDANGTLLPHEVELWDPEGESLVWVKVPSVSGTETAITMYWGGNAGKPAVNATDVWAGNDYAAVWHYSGNANDSVNGITPAKANGTPAYTVLSSNPSPVGACFTSDGTGTVGFVPDGKWNVLGEGNTLTLSSWVRFDGTSANYARILSSMSNWVNMQGWELTIQRQINEITVGSSGQSQFQTTITPSPANRWVYLTVVYNADQKVYLYVNGAKVSEKNLKPLVAPTEDLWIGSCNGSGNLWNGGIDESRIRAVAASAEWVKACYDTMASDAFVVAAAAEEIPHGAEKLTVRDAGVTFTGTTATIAGRMTKLGAGAASATVQVRWGLTESLELDPVSVDSFTSVPVSFTATLPNLTPGARYYYSIHAVNDCGDTEDSETASFVVNDPSVLGAASASVNNLEITVSGSLAYAGSGVTTVRLLAGTDPAEMSVVKTWSEVTTATDLTYSFSAKSAASYYLAYECENTCNGVTWSGHTDTVPVLTAYADKFFLDRHQVTNVTANITADKRVGLAMRSMLYMGWTELNMKELYLAGPIAAIPSYKPVTVASFRAEPGAFVQLSSVSTFKVTDPSGIRLVGGSQTLAAPGSQIPVAIQFLQNVIDESNVGQYKRFGFGLCTYDATEGVKLIPASTMAQGFEGAGEHDNVFLSKGNHTLATDATVNAVAADDVMIDLGGNTLRVKSGMLVGQQEGWTGVPTDMSWTGGRNVALTNGTLAIDEPFFSPRVVNNNSPNLAMVKLTTPSNTDVRKIMFTTCGWGGTPMISTVDFSEFVGTVCFPEGDTQSTAANFNKNVAVETINGFKIGNSHNQINELAGVGGDCTIQQNENCINIGLFIGDTTSKNQASQVGVIAVGDKGFLAPGTRSGDGCRKGTMNVNYYYAYNNKCLTDVKFLEGGELDAAVRMDGSSTLLNLGQVSLTIEDGAKLVVESPDSLTKLAGNEFVIAKSEKPIVGCFANRNVTPGFKAKVRQLSDDTYAVVVTAQAKGFRVIIK